MTKARWALGITRGVRTLRQVVMILPRSPCLHFERGLLLKVCDARQSRHGTAGLEPRISRPAQMHAMLSVSGIRENPVRSVTP